MQKQKKEKLRYKGVFICNQRKKRPGGRIKCPQFPNKIEIFKGNQAIHESEVQWIEVRRYKREKRNVKQPQTKNITQAKATEEKYPKKQVEKDKKLKFKVKDDGQGLKNKTQYQHKNIDKKEQKKQIKSNAQQEKIQAQPKTKKSYIKKQEPTHQSNEKKQSKDASSMQAQSSQSKIDQSTSHQGSIKSQANNNEQSAQSGSLKEVQVQRERRDDDGKVNEKDDSSSESEQELQIIVAQIVKQTKIIYKTKPFVAIMNFFKNDRRRNNKHKKVYDNPIQQILEDFFVDIVPIHPRLPVMEMDEYVERNKQILFDYVLKHLNYNDKESKRRSQLNRIIDQMSNTYIFVTFSDWDGNYPLARIQKVLGKALTIQGQCQRFLYEHGLNDLQYEESQEQLKNEIKVEPTNLHKPVNRMVFSIDPPTSTDLDDALSIQQVGDLFQIGIHIADVSSYLDCIDRNEITKRTTSVYLPYKVFHMLERQLVKICSLDPGVERLAFTVWVNMDLEGNVVGETRLEKNVIKSRFKLYYQIVQNIVTGKCFYPQFSQRYECSEEEFDILQQKLLNLTNIAKKHREKRVFFDVFQNKELEFKTDQENWPIQCFIDKRYTAKKMVEEFMIIGNIESAKFLVKSQLKNALVIHHPKPSKLAVTSFNQSFKILQTKFKFENVIDVQKQLLQLQKRENVLEQIKKACYFRARRVMEPAIYRKYDEIIQEQKKEAQKLKLKEKEKEKLKQTESNQVSILQSATFESNVQNSPIVHFALGLQFYTHFTSPMRRMADILVHQVLTKTLQGQAAVAIQSSQIQKINNGRRSTKRLKKDLNEVYICLMIYRTKNPLSSEGIILSFGLQSVSIYIPLFDMQKQIHWKKEFNIHSVSRVKNKEDCLDIKVKHDRKSAKGDIYWVVKKFEKVKLIIDCNKVAPLRLTIDMEVQSEKGPYLIEWIHY